jgi:hypothetical protein
MHNHLEYSLLLDAQSFILRATRLLQFVNNAQCFWTIVAASLYVG